MPNTRLHIRVSRELIERLDKYCQHHGVDKTSVVKIAIVEYLDRRETQYQLSTAKAEGLSTTHG